MLGKGEERVRVSEKVAVKYGEGTVVTCLHAQQKGTH